MSRIRRFFALHSNPVNFVGALAVFLGLIKWSLHTVIYGAIAWSVGSMYQLITEHRQKARDKSEGKRD